MSSGVKVYILRVFVDENGEFGNPVGVILDQGKKIAPKERQRITTQLGFSESVFVNNVDTGNVSIFNPQEEVVFAGHAMVGTAWLINKSRNHPIDSLTCPCGSIKTWRDKDKTWIRASLAMIPLWKYEQVKNTIEVEHLSVTSSKEHTFVWAWENEKKGLIRARTFAADWGIPEDEANGSGSMKLAATLGRNIEIMHGKGSIIYAKPRKSDFADLGGRVKEE